MQSHYAASFMREMGCTEAEWLAWLPAAIGTHPWQRYASRVTVQIALPNQDTGRLALRWEVGPVRRIALMHIPCLHVYFDFSDMDEAQRYTFMRRFDLYMQRGGG